jgi:hypothetical protein
MSFTPEFLVCTADFTMHVVNIDMTVTRTISLTHLATKAFEYGIILLKNNTLYELEGRTVDPQMSDIILAKKLVSYFVIVDSASNVKVFSGSTVLSQHRLLNDELLCVDCHISDHALHYVGATAAGTPFSIVKSLKDEKPLIDSTKEQTLHKSKSIDAFKDSVTFADRKMQFKFETSDRRISLVILRFEKTIVEVSNPRLKVEYFDDNVRR